MADKMYNFEAHGFHINREKVNNNNYYYYF